MFSSFSKWFIEDQSRRREENGWVGGFSGSHGLDRTSQFAVQLRRNPNPSCLAIQALILLLPGFRYGNRVWVLLCTYGGVIKLHENIGQVTRWLSYEGVHFLRRESSLCTLPPRGKRLLDYFFLPQPLSARPRASTFDTSLLGGQCYEPALTPVANFTHEMSHQPCRKHFVKRLRL